VRAPLDRERLERFLVAFGGAVRGPGTVYLTGGATAILVGWRERTIDIDLRLDPEPPGAFEAIARLKEALDVNVELASPADFLPAVPGWQDRSRHVGRYGPVTVRHYDPTSQVLAKLARGYERDLTDARALIEAGLATPTSVRLGFAAVVADLPRFPRLDAETFTGRVTTFLRGFEVGSDSEPPGSDGREPA